MKEAKVVKKIREMFPELLKPTAGCEVEYIGRKWVVAVCSIKNNVMLTSKIYRSVIIEPERIDKIIGHEPQLRHLMEAITQIHGQCYIENSLQYQGCSIRYRKTNSDGQYEPREIYIDLTQSLVANLQKHESTRNGAYEALLLDENEE